MIPFFNSQERKQALIDEAQSWIGTPFMPYCQSKGRGTDCVRLVGSILANTGAIPPIEWRKFPKYSMDWSSHHDKPILEDAIKFLELDYQRIEKDEPIRIGDVLAFAPGKVVYHLAIFTGRNQMIHALRTGGVDYIPLSEPTLLRFYRYAMRPIEPIEPET